MKILHVINSSNNGGAPKMIVELYNEMIKKHSQSKLVFLQRIESQYSQIDRAIYLSNKLKSPIDYLRVFLRLKKLIKEERPDVLISFLPLSNIMCGILGKILNVKYRIASQRNPPFIYGRSVRILDRFLGSRDYYTHNVCNSKAGLQAFSHYPDSYKKYLSVINNCVEIPDFSISKEEARSELNIDANSFVLTCIGRLHDQKNHSLIVDAMNYVDNAILYLGGDGPLKREISNQIESNGLQEKIIMLGDLNRREVRLLLRASDVFLIPSKYEGLSNSLIEAMSYGLPIVCSNIPSFIDFLKVHGGVDGFSGLIIGGDAEQWGHGINKLIEDKELRLKYQQLSINQVADLTAEKMTQKFALLFEQ